MVQHTLLVVIRDNAGENKSQESIDFFESMGIKNHYSTAHEQWQNGLPETAINSIMMIGIVGRVGRATARDALCRGFDPCRQRPRGVAVDFGPKQSGWLINQLGNSSFIKNYHGGIRAGRSNLVQICNDML